MQKLEKLGCSKAVVALAVPTGFSFNLDGTAIYLSVAVLFIAQAFNVPLTWLDQLSILALLLVTSKGAAGVSGSGFVTLAATLTALNYLPVEGLGLLFGIDFFMSAGRALTNIIGNTVGTLIISRLSNEFSQEQALDVYRRYFNQPNLSHL
jgi:aerobic C4-dicarboxylate transport protein